MMRLSLAWLACAGVLLAGCAGTGSDPEPVEATRVVIPGPWVFEPEAILVPPGTSVTFENRGGATHSVTIAALGVDFDLAPGESRDVAFEGAGDYAYVCKYHPPDMRGRVVVATTPPG